MIVLDPEYKWSGYFVTRLVTDEVILHHAAAAEASAEQIHAQHIKNGWVGIAYHYYIRKDGTIYRGRPENVVGGHTLNENWHSIGICFEGNYETQIMPEAQLHAGQALLADIRTRYHGISVSAHRDHNATACPGRNFPFDEMTEEVEEVETYKTLGNVPVSYRPTIQKLMERGALVGRSNPDPQRLDDNVLELDETYCRVMTTLDKLGMI